jgi:hypothetical protein
MTSKPITEAIAASLTVSERLLLFCITTDTDWAAAGITGATARTMQVKGLIERDQAATRLVLTEQGQAVLTAMLGGARQ